MTQIARWLSSSGPSPAEIPVAPEAWAALETSVVRTGLAGLLLEAASAYRIELPGDLAGRVRAAAMAVAANNIHLQAELAGIIRRGVARRL